MAFRDIAGHARVIDSLRGALASGRAAASLIFHGPEGVGRRATALALAQAFNCEREPLEGCGACSPCARIAHVERGRIEEGDRKGDAREITHHADVRILVPGKEEIRIDDIRTLRQQAQRRPFEGKRSVFILDPADRMTTEAANALLKTLEEPPPTTCLILIARAPEALLPTIRSRCRLVPFHPLPEARVAAYLEEKRGVAASDARLIASLTSGRLGAAVDFDLEGHREARSGILEVLARLAAAKPRAHVLKDIEALGSKEEDSGIEARLAILETLLRDAMVLGAGGAPARVINQDVTEDLRLLAAAFGAGLPGSLKRVAEARRDLGWNVNKALLLETLLLDLTPAALARS